MTTGEPSAKAAGHEHAPTPGTPRLLREINDRAALRLLVARGPLSRSQLGAMTGLSKPTASLLLSRLESAGLVIQVGVQQGGPGPSAALYQINPAAGHVGGVDVTSSRVSAAIADLTGRVTGRHEISVTGRSARGAIERVGTALEGAASQAGIPVTGLVHVVVGTPGAIDPRTGQLGYARHLAGWHGPDIAARLRTAIVGEHGTVGIDIENDVNLAAVAERHEGEATDSANFIELWISDGIGMAIVLDGALHRGASGGAGEVGYMPLPGAPVVHNIGRGTTGGFQAAAGAPAVVKLAREHGIATRDAVTAVRRAALAHKANEPAGRMLDELAERLATGLATIVTVLDPELVVLTGGILLAGGTRLRDLVLGALHGMAIPRPRLVLSSVAGNPVLVGAIHAALDVAREIVFASHGSAEAIDR